MEPLHGPPPGWFWHASPWSSLTNDRQDFPELVRVGAVLLPEFFFLSIGTEGMLSTDDSPYPGEDDFALFLHFQVFEGRLCLDEARSAGLDLPTAYEKVRKVVPPGSWKRLGILEMTRYLSETSGVAADPDDDFPLPRPEPAAHARWLQQMEAAGRHRHPANRFKRRPRSRITDEFLQEVANVYRDAENMGEPPTRAVANYYSAPHSTAAKWVSAARRKDMLPAAAR